MQYKMREVIGEYCITLEDGQKVYELIHPQLIDGLSVELDFTRVKVFASPFFNFGIGQLLEDLQVDELNRLLKFTNLNAVGTSVLQRVIQNAKRYYSDEHFHNAVDEVLAEQAVSL